MPDMVQVSAGLLIIAALVFFLADKFNRLWIERSWRQHSASHGDMDSLAHVRHKTLSARLLERSAPAVVASTVRQVNTMANKFMENIRMALDALRPRWRSGGPAEDTGR
jgi:hypothetical protein